MEDKMVDIAAIHRGTKSPLQLASFLRGAAFRRAEQQLLANGVEPERIMVQQPGERGVHRIVKVHPLIGLEYMRWAHYDRYAAWLEKLL